MIVIALWFPKNQQSDVNLVFPLLWIRHTASLLSGRQSGNQISSKLNKSILSQPLKLSHLKEAQRDDTVDKGHPARRWTATRFPPSARGQAKVRESSAELIRKVSYRWWGKLCWKWEWNHKTMCSQRESSRNESNRDSCICDLWNDAIPTVQTFLSH